MNINILLAGKQNAFGNTAVVQTQRQQQALKVNGVKSC